MRIRPSFSAPEVVSLKRQSRLLLAFLLFFLATAWRCAYSLEAPPSESPDYRLRPGDRIAITLITLTSDTPYTTPQGGLEIPPDGKISFFNVEVQAAGKTREEVRRELVEGAKQYIKAPSITVNLLLSPYNFIAVNGAVSRPGEFAYRDGITVLEALALAGGPRETANDTAYLFRKGGDGSPNPIEIDIGALSYGQTGQNYRLQPGDILQVNDAVVYVDGKIRVPGPQPYRTSSTVAKAIAAAGGLTADPDLKNAFIRRGDQTIVTDLRTVVGDNAEADATPVPLLPGDLLYIPELKSKVTVIGDVKNAGVVHLIPKDRDKLLDVFSAAGGAAPTADLKNVYVRRMTNGNQQIEMTLNVSPSGSPSNNVILEDGDIVYVPQKKVKDRTQTLFTASLLTQILSSLKNF
jgi:polysaccharide export outer membrane protein